MSYIMDNRLETENKELEVKKLQELVKQLELQNEELRSERQNLITKTEDEKSENEKADNETKDSVNCDKVIKPRPTSIDSLPLDLKLKLGPDDQFSSDDETWLFDSPKIKCQTEEWLRKDMDDPTLVVVKKSLVKKLDDIANSPHHSPRHSIYSPSSSSGVLSPESPPSRGEIDTRTFVRPKKKRTLLFEGRRDPFRNNCQETNGVKKETNGPGPKELIHRSNGSLGSEEDLDRLSSNSDGSYTSYRLTDVENVNNMARLQEESLKNSEPRTYSRLPPGIHSNVRGTSPLVGVNSYSSARSSGGSAASSQEDLLTSPLGSQSNIRRMQPHRSSALQQPRRYNIPASRENSDMSTPPDSPYNSQQNLESCNGRGVGSRLPSLNRRLGNSDSRLLERQVSPNNSRTASPLSHLDKTPPTRVSRLQAPQARPSRLSAPSPVRIPMATPHLTEFSSRDPQEEYRATPSGLQRPRSRLQAPRPRMSPSPAKPSAQSASDWREGCY